LFASYLYYQGINVVLALVSLLFLRWTRRLTWVRPDGFLCTPFRCYLWVRCPVYVVFMSVFTLVFFLVSQDLARPISSAMGRQEPWVRFLGMGVSFYAGVFLLPLIGLILSLRTGNGPLLNRRAAAIDRCAAGLWLLASFGLGYECMWRGPGSIRVEETKVALADWPESLPPMRVVVLADLQTALLTGRERAVSGIVESLKPDLIVIPGDLVAQSLEPRYPIESARHVLGSITAPLGVYAVNGDVDAAVPGELWTVLRGTDAILLDNGAELLHAGFPIELAGFDPHRGESFRALLSAPPLSSLRIALVHRPDHARQIADAGFDLVIAGHTHGGQVVIPGLGPPYVNSSVSRKIGAGGLHALTERSQLYVSRGIGLEAGFAPPIRLFCPPEISLLILGPQPTSDPSSRTSSH